MDLMKPIFHPVKKDILEKQQNILADLVDDTTLPGPSASCPMQIRDVI